MTLLSHARKPVALAVMLMLTGCGGGGSSTPTSTPTPAPNQAPIASAGADLTVNEAAAVLLFANESAHIFIVYSLVYLGDIQC